MRNESNLVAETQFAVLSNRLAWKVLAHRRNQRLALSETTNEERPKDLGCCTKTVRKLSVQKAIKSLIAEVERASADSEHDSFSLRLVLA
eukprot:2202042-Rhodomonas_salina.1